MAGYCTFTFDDGSDVHYSVALPLFNAQGEVAVACINASTIGAANKLTWGQVRALFDAGWEIANHSYSHQDLTAISEAEVYKEVSLGKRMIETHGLPHGIRVESFSWPFSVYDATSIRIVRNFHKVGRTGEGANPAAIPEVHAIESRNIDNPAQIATYQGYIVAAEAANSWLIFYMHGIAAADEDTLNTLIDDCQSQGVTICTLADGYNLTKHRLPGVLGGESQYKNRTLPDATITPIVDNWPRPYGGIDVWLVATYSYGGAVHGLVEFFVEYPGSVFYSQKRVIKTELASIVSSFVDNGDNTYDIRVNNTSGASRKASARQLHYLDRLFLTDG